MKTLENKKRSMKLTPHLYSQLNTKILIWTSPFHFVCKINQFILHRSNHWRCSIKKKLFLKISQDSFPILLESHFNKVIGLQVCNFLKNESNTGVIPVNIANFLRAPILKNICRQLLCVCFHLIN